MVRALLWAALLAPWLFASCALSAALGPHTVPQGERAYLQPAPGRVLHFTGGTVGQYDKAVEYARMTGPALAPIGDSLWIAIPGPRPWELLRGKITKRLAQYREYGSAVSLSLRFDDGNKGPISASDLDVANGKYDALVDELAHILKDSGVPILLRIGNEVNGPWEGHHPYAFPKAFRRIVTRFRAIDVPNVGFAWCVCPGGDPEIFATNDAGEPRWFPGDDVVDWYAVDVFAPIHFSGLDPSHPPTKEDAVIPFRLVNAARRAKKPVFVSETTPLQMMIRPLIGTAGREESSRIWRDWFRPFLDWLDAYPEVQGVTMLSVDWTRTRKWSDWGDARIQNNPFLAEAWRAELRSERWVHWVEFADHFDGARWDHY